MTDTPASALLPLALRSLRWLSVPGPAPFQLAPDTARVLVVSLDHHLGNSVIQLPVIAALARYFVAGIDLLIDARYAELATALEPADRPRRVRPYPAQRDSHFRKHKPLAAIARVWADVLAARYEAVIDLSGGKWSAAVTRASLARNRVGFADVLWPRCYNRLVVRPAESPAGPHTLDRYAAALTVIGAAAGARPPAIRLSAGSEDPGLAADVRWVVINPFAGKAWRLWPAERFAEVARRLIDICGLGVVVVGAQGDRPAGEALVASIGRPERTRFLSPPLPRLLAIFKQASLLISNESGPTHLAATTEVPIVTIFGPTVEAVWRPLREQGVTVLRGAACDPACTKALRCVAAGSCLTALPVDAVVEAALAELALPASTLRSHLAGSLGAAGAE